MAVVAVRVDDSVTELIVVTVPEVVVWVRVVVAEVVVEIVSVTVLVLVSVRLVSVSVVSVVLVVVMLVSELVLVPVIVEAVIEIEVAVVTVAVVVVVFDIVVWLVVVRVNDKVVPVDEVTIVAVCVVDVALGTMYWHLELSSHVLLGCARQKLSQNPKRLLPKLVQPTKGPLLGGGGNVTTQPLPPRRQRLFVVPLEVVMAVVVVEDGELGLESAVLTPTTCHVERSSSTTASATNWLPLLCIAWSTPLPSAAWLSASNSSCARRSVSICTPTLHTTVRSSNEVEWPADAVTTINSCARISKCSTLANACTNTAVNSEM